MRAGALLQNLDLVNLYSNPASAQLNVQLSNNFISSPIKILVTDMLGREILDEEKVAEGNDVSLPLDEKMSNGIYLLTIQSQQSSAQELFEVQR